MASCRQIYGRNEFLPNDRMAALIAWMPVVRVGNLVKDRRPPISAFTRVFDALWAAALRAVLDKITNTNN
jgi:hypothetical protein